MAIVVAIMGVLLVGVLQGRELIANAEYKSFKSSLRDYDEAFQIFRDRYNALPGDFAEAESRLGLDSGANGTGNGVVDGGADCTSGSDEGCRAWAHLRAADLVNGATDAAPPDHPYADRFSGFSTGNDGNGVFGHKLLVDSVPAEIARRLDNELDDGACTAGRISSTGCNGTDWPNATDVDLVYAL